MEDSGQGRRNRGRRGGQPRQADGLALLVLDPEEDKSSPAKAGKCSLRLDDEIRSAETLRGPHAVDTLPIELKCRR